MSELIVLHDCATIQLTRGHNTLVDADDFPWLSQIKWQVFVKKGRPVYASASRGGRKVWLHRLVARIPDGMVTDHANLDGFDNRRANLRAASKSANSANRGKINRPTTSRYKGVSWHKGGRKWWAKIEAGDRRISLGLFSSESEAALAYNRAAIEHHGEFARLNDIAPGPRWRLVFAQRHPRGAMPLFGAAQTA